VSLKENDYEQRRSQVRVLPSAPKKYCNLQVNREAKAKRRESMLGPVDTNLRWKALPWRGTICLQYTLP